MGKWTVPILPVDLEDAHSYAERSRNHTKRKLEHQQSRYSDTKRKIVVGRVARNVVARALRDAGVSCHFEETPATRAKHYSILTSDGHFIQPRFIGDYPRHKNYLEDVGSFETRPHEFYVATVSLDDLCDLDILGYATRDELGERRPRPFGHGVLNRYVPLDQLHPFAELIGLLSSPETLSGVLRVDYSTSGQDRERVPSGVSERSCTDTPPSSGHTGSAATRSRRSEVS